MSKRISSSSFPDPPKHWDASSQDVWRRLIQILSASEEFGVARRNKTQFVIKGTVSVPVTLDLTNPEVTANALILANLLVALRGSQYVDVRTTVA